MICPPPGYLSPKAGAAKIFEIACGKQAPGTRKAPSTKLQAPEKLQSPNSKFSHSKTLV
jgi:hypothetical protein